MDRPVVAPAPEPTPAASAGATLLVVDDEPSVLSALRRLFRLHGYRVVQADSGAQGLELLAVQPVDVVISDMRMPGMNGAHFLEQVRLRHPEAVRLLLTGYADMGSTVEAINRGEIHRYIAKPWSDEDLLLIVRDALARRDLERRHAELVELTRLQNEQLAEANRTLEARVAARTSELEQLNGMLETAYQDLDQTFTLAVNVFSGLMEMREGSAGHARRVADLVQPLARTLGLGDREVRDVHLAALLHDVGKIGFPDRMLGRPVSTYTVEEMVRYRRHPVDGETALMPLTQLRGAARLVRQHHERLDGKGFPDGLAGDEVAIGARLISVASDWDSLVHGLAAESRHTPERARQILRSGIGSHYEARVVEALFDVLSAAEAAAGQDCLVAAHELRPGMVLARDLTSPRGAILLAAGFVFDDRMIRQLRHFVDREQLRPTLYVLPESRLAHAPRPHVVA